MDFIHNDQVPACFAVVNLSQSNVENFRVQSLKAPRPFYRQRYPYLTHAS